MVDGNLQSLTSKDDSLYLFQGEDGSSTVFGKLSTEKRILIKLVFGLENATLRRPMTVVRQWPSYFARRSAVLTGGIDVELFDRAGSRVEQAFTSCCRDTCRNRGITRKRRIELSSGHACPPCYC